MVARGSRIDRAALALVYGDVAVRRERFGGDLPAPLKQPARGEHRGIERVLVAGRGFQREDRLAYVARDEADDAAERVRAVEARRAALHDFDARHGFARHAA